MVLDTSAVVCILTDEPERASFISAMEMDQVKLMSAVSLLETVIVLESRFGRGFGTKVDLWLRAAGVEIVPFDMVQSSLAQDAWRSYGKGRHPAALNFGDCCVYALAKQTGESLLFKGNDFNQTDLLLVS